LPVFTSGIPANEIARSLVTVCWVVLVPVDVGLVSAHAVAVPTPSARRGAPAHIVTAPNTAFFIGGFLRFDATHGFVDRGRDSARINDPHGLPISRNQ
jgi:hypothetical protein